MSIYINTWKWTNPYGCLNGFLPISFTVSPFRWSNMYLMWLYKLVVWDWLSLLLLLRRSCQLCWWRNMINVRYRYSFNRWGILICLINMFLLIRLLRGCIVWRLGGRILMGYNMIVITSMHHISWQIYKLGRTTILGS